MSEYCTTDDKEEYKRRLSSEQEFWSSQRIKLVNRLHSLFHSSGLTLATKKQMITVKRGVPI